MGLHPLIPPRSLGGVYGHADNRGVRTALKEALTCLKIYITNIVPPNIMSKAKVRSIMNVIQKHKLIHDYEIYNAIEKDLKQL